MSRLRRLAAFAGALLVLVSALPAGAQSLDDQLQSVSARIDAISAQIDAQASSRTSVADEVVGTKARMDELLGDLARARGQLQDVERDLTVRRLHLDGIRDDLQRNYVKLAETRQVLVDTRSVTADWARQMYMSAGHSLTEMAFSVTAVDELALSLAYMDRVSAHNEVIVSRLESLEVQEQRQRELIAEQESSVTAEVTDLEVMQGQLVDLRDTIAARSSAVQDELDRQRSLLAEIDRQIDEFEGELASLEKEQGKIEQLIAEQTTSAGTAPGILMRPVPGAISSGFGYRWHPILGIRRLHAGADMTAASGTPIVAAGSGRVILAARNGGYGNCVVIDHGGGMTTLYAHQSKMAVSFGDQVSAGQVIGYVGSTGLSTGPHLHFEVRLGGKPVDPVPYL